MRVAEWDDKVAVCPFFRRLRVKSREIVCEAAVPEAAISAQRFASVTRMREYFNDFCGSRACAGCVHYQAVRENYED